MNDTKRLEDLQRHLKKLSWLDRRLYRNAITALPNQLQEDEQIEKLVTGRYQDTYGILIATNKRIIFIGHSHMFGLTTTDYPHDKISFIWWMKGMTMGAISLIASGNKIQIGMLENNTVRDFCDYVTGHTMSYHQHAKNIVENSSASLNKTHIDRNKILIYFEQVPALDEPMKPETSNWPLGIRSEDKFKLSRYEEEMKDYLSRTAFLANEPIDSQIDEWLMADIERISNETYEKLNISKNEIIEKQEVFLGPPGFWDTFYLHKTRIGKDGISRSSRYTISCLNFSNKQVLFYTCLLNFETGKLEKESSHELFYDNIVSVELAKDKLNNYSIELHTSASTKTSLPFIISGRSTQEHANQLVNKLRSIIRSKRY